MRKNFGLIQNFHVAKKHLAILFIRTPKLTIFRIPSFSSHGEGTCADLYFSLRDFTAYIQQNH